MNNYVPSNIRTWIPIIIGSVLAWLAAKTGFVLDENSQAGLVAAFTALVSGLYYAVVRFLELKFPIVGWFLGLPKQPGYVPGNVPPPEPPPVPNA